MGRVQKALETRNRILDAAEDVFNHEGVTRTTLHDIAKAAGVTRGAIYWHFKNKFDLFEAMFNRFGEPMAALLEAVIENDAENPLDELYKVGEFVLQQVAQNAQHRKVMNILFHKCEYIDSSSSIWKLQQEWRSQRVSMIQKILQKARDKGQLPPQTDILWASTLIHATYIGLLSSWLFMPESFDLMKDATRINKSILTALSTGALAPPPD